MQNKDSLNAAGTDVLRFTAHCMEMTAVQTGGRYA